MTMQTKTMMIEMMIEIAKKYPVADRDGFETELRAMSDDCDDCKVSKMNEGGCDCQLIKCAECGEEGHKYNHHLCEGSLLCDDCYDTWACEQDGYENECDEFNLRNEDDE